jgi:hypothetical protein
MLCAAYEEAPYQEGYSFDGEHIFNWKLSQFEPMECQHFNFVQSCARLCTPGSFRPKPLAGSLMVCSSPCSQTVQKSYDNTSSGVLTKFQTPNKNLDCIKCGLSRAQSRCVSRPLQAVRISGYSTDIGCRWLISALCLWLSLFAVLHSEALRSPPLDPIPTPPNIPPILLH